MKQLEAEGVEFRLAENRNYANVVVDRTMTEILSTKENNINQYKMTGKFANQCTKLDPQCGISVNKIKTNLDNALLETPVLEVSKY